MCKRLLLVGLAVLLIAAVLSPFLVSNAEAKTTVTIISDPGCDSGMGVLTRFYNEDGDLVGSAYGCLNVVGG